MSPQPESPQPLSPEPPSSPISTSKAITVPQKPILPIATEKPQVRPRPTSLTTDDLPLIRRSKTLTSADFQKPTAPLSGVKPNVKPKPILRRNSVTIVNSSVVSTLQNIRCTKCRNPVTNCVCSYERSTGVKKRRPASIAAPTSSEHLMASHGQFGHIATMKCHTCMQILAVCKCDHRAKRPGSVCEDIGVSTCLILVLTLW
jgi:hypothetical protein